MRENRRFARRLGVALTLVAMLLALPAAAPAQDFEITDFTGAFVDPVDGGAVRAGSHPDFTTRFDLSPRVDENGNIFAFENVKDVVVDLPEGLIGNPQAMPQCPASLLTAPGSFRGDCSPDTQVGKVTVSAAFGFPMIIRDQEPIFNIIPPPGVTARFGFVVLGNVVYLDAAVTADRGYHVSVSSPNTSQGLALTSVETTFWGDPNHPVHDIDRMPCLAINPDVPGTAECPTSAPRRPFMTFPTYCSGGPLESRLGLNTWQNTDRWLTASFDEDTQGQPIRVEGCDDLPFAPSLNVTPETRAPDSPSGLDVNLSIPQSEDPDGLATAHLKDVEVTLPEGMTINPASAGGLAACTDAEFGLGDDAPAECPAAAKIGTVTAVTPLLEEELSGGVYVRSQASNDPESGEMFRIGLVLESAERGVRVKLGGNVSADAETGRLTTVFANNPQMPVEQIELAFKSGPRAPLATPPTCGEKTVDATLTSWAGHAVERQSSFTIDCAAGTGGFSPSFLAGTTRDVGGAFAPFALQIAKPDGQAPLTGISVDLPQGLLAKLAGNLGTRVGTVLAYAGPGRSPFALPGRVFLEGPYGDAPYSLRVVVPAKAGPFDLGEVVVRQKLLVDPETTEVTVVSDPLPAIVGGVPVRLQALEVDVDKPGFVVNPTSCAAKTIDAVLSAADGQRAAVASRFQASECSALTFTPKLGLRLTGRGQMRSGGHPALGASLAQAAGQANIRQAKVTLPKGIALDSRNAFDPKILCGYDASLKADCPASSVIGRASATSPLLDRPLSGPVHLVQGIRFGPSGNRIRTLPTLLVKLRGQIAINLRSKTNVDRSNRLVSTFPSVPDAAVSRFSLRIDGGRKGILVVTESRRGRIDLCSRRQTAIVETDGHNGKRADYTARVKTACGKRGSRNR